MKSRAVYCLATAIALMTGLSQGERRANNTYEWTPAGALLSPRAGGCAAALPDGSVLITGGEAPEGAQSAAEIYRVSGRGNAAPPMLGARAGHLCVALADGQVLVAGGNTAAGAPTNAAELYDPRAQVWRAAGPMRSARIAATASLLPDGRVLIAGGESFGAPLASLEIFDPASESFTAVSPTMAMPRTRHAAAVLRDGRVLLAGGFDGRHALRSIDVFDPLAGSVSALAQLSVPRARLSAVTLLDGRVYFAGGDNETGVLASTEIYDPVQERLVPAAPMSAPRAGHAALRIPRNNSVLLSAGDAAAAELYIPWTNSYRRLASPPGRRSGAFVVPLAGGLVLTAGARADAQAVATVALPVISTDKSDYQPGDQVTISGANWKPGEVVSIGVTRSPTARSLQLTTTADAGGSFVYKPAELVMTPDDVGQTYTLTAAGNLGSTAQAIVFTDGSVSSASVSIRQSNCVTPQTVFTLGATVCASTTVAIQGSGAGDYRIQWYAPGFVPNVSTPVRDILVSNAANNSTQTDTFAPNSTGTWTFVACKGSNAGPCSSGQVANGSGATFNVNPPPDSTPPVITPTVTGTLGANGWYTSNVQISWTVTDAESAVSSTGCGPATVSTDTAGQTFTCSATSGGGTSSQSVTIKRDATAPSISGSRSPAANANGWNNTSVGVSFTCTDVTSGLASIVATGAASGSSASSPLNVSVSAEGAAQSVQGSCSDQAGNSANTAVSGINIDLTAPVASATSSPAANSYGWNNTDVTVTFTATDALSGVDSCSAPITLTTEGANQTSASGTCVDKAGNVSAAVNKSGINIDKTPPTAAASAAPAPNGAGWNNTPVTVTFQGTDALSGIASCDSSVVVSTEGSNVSSPSGTCTDKAGNVSAPVNKTGLKIDLTAPTLTFGSPSPAANGFGWNNTNVSISFTASDALSGVATTTPSSPLSFSSEGSGQTGTVQVTDAAGNTASFVSPAVNIDKTAPGAPSAAVSPLPNGAGWNNSVPVTVQFTGVDALSGIAGCTVPAAIVAETAGTSVTGYCTDKAGNNGPAGAVTVKVDLKAPDAPSNVVAPPAGVGSPGTLTALTTDPAIASGIAIAQFNVDGGVWSNMAAAAGGSFGQASVNVTASLPAFADTGVHTVCVRATDVAGNSGPSSCAYYAIYDPSAGFVTGGGWITSPPGAYAPNPALTGKANFGFVSKYQKGATVPTGNTEFQFQEGSFNFKSSSYEWLVISGARAQYKGLGTVNGAAGYGFLLTAIDGSVSGGGGSDKFRLKVWNTSSGSILYDNQMGADDGAALTTVLGGGSIVIHSGK